KSELSGIVSLTQNELENCDVLIIYLYYNGKFIIIPKRDFKEGNRYNLYYDKNGELSQLKEFEDRWDLLEL
ncbi:MAG: hypothetical protein ACFFD1_16410, partial [Candidatus Thorarchaeota archaeon]